MSAEVVAVVEEVEAVLVFAKAGAAALTRMAQALVATSFIIRRKAKFIIDPVPIAARFLMRSRRNVPARLLRAFRWIVVMRPDR